MPFLPLPKPTNKKILTLQFLQPVMKYHNNSIVRLNYYINDQFIKS